MDSETTSEPGAKVLKEHRWPRGSSLRDLFFLLLLSLLPFLRPFRFSCNFLMNMALLLPRINRVAARSSECLRFNSSVAVTDDENSNEDEWITDERRILLTVFYIIVPFLDNILRQQWCEI